MLDADWVYFRVAPKEMTFVNRIIEGCDYLGVVTALDGKEGVGFSVFIFPVLPANSS